jgi:hypothetical protein
VIPGIRYEENANYFKETGCLALGGAGCGGLLIITGLLAGAGGAFSSGSTSGLVIGMILVGLVFVIPGVVAIARPKASPEALDAAVQAVGRYAQSLSPQKLGIPSGADEIRPVAVVGYSSTGKGFDGALHVKRGKDGVVRTSRADALVMHFTRDQVHVLTLSVNLVPPAGIVEQTAEFFYQDVVSLGTSTDPNGTSLTFVVAGGQTYSCPVSNPTAPDSEIVAARSLIRAKRASSD